VCALWCAQHLELGEVTVEEKRKGEDQSLPYETMCDQTRIFEKN
jgi:hypothetical protein